MIYTVGCLWSSSRRAGYHGTGSSVHPGQGLTQAIEKAETSLGIPSPTEVSAQVEQEEREQGECWVKCVRLFLLTV